MDVGSTITPREKGPPESGDSVPEPGPISAEALDSIIDESERAHATVASPDGMSRVDGEDERHVDVPVVVVATNEQLYFASPGSNGDATEAGTLRYEQLAGVDSGGDGISLTTVDGIQWRLPLGARDDAAAVTLIERLGWIGTFRSRIVARKNDVELAAGEITDAAADMDWERGEERYESQRTALDGLLDTLSTTEWIDTDAIAPELEDAERTLERSYAKLLIERSDSRLTLGQQLVRSADHERAREVIDRARVDYEDACEHADSVARDDAFVFGEQRELEDRLERLGWEIQAVTAEPLRRAHEAKVLARSASDPEETVTHWEAAFRRYGTVLSLQDGEADSEITGDLGEVRRELENAAGQLIAIHRALARSQWDAGIEAAAHDVDEGIETLESAISHLERSLELASEFRPDATADLRGRVEKMRAGLEKVRRAPAEDPATDDEAVANQPGTSESDPDTGEQAIDETGGSEDLADMDSHHEIHLDGNVGEGPGDDSRKNGDSDDGLEREVEFILPDPTDSE